SYGEGSIPSGAWIVIEGTELRYKAAEKTAFQADADFRIPVAAESAGSDYTIDWAKTPNRTIPAGSA
ncbi:MAG: hypothetical protein LBB98_07595, partial [Treponema sp.]|nr:hypothetical protein [Treponema sp.]